MKFILLVLIYFNDGDVIEGQKIVRTEAECLFTASKVKNKAVLVKDVIYVSTSCVKVAEV